MGLVVSLEPRCRVGGERQRGRAGLISGYSKSPIALASRHIWCLLVNVCRKDRRRVTIGAKAVQYHVETRVYLEPIRNSLQ